MTRIEEIEARKAEIREIIADESADVNLDELTEEVRSLNAEVETIKETAAKADELRSLVAKGEGEIVEAAEIIEERKEPEKMEIRNTPEYINAYANYIKTGRDNECRALVTDMNSGSVPVPELVDEFVRTAWDRDEITRRVRKAYLKGIVKVGFEASATGAVIHDEGDEAPSEETLTLGIVTMVPATIKKWISITTEVEALTGEAFLRYIYEELTYQIAKKLAAEIVHNIATSPAASNSSQPGVPTIEVASPALDTVAQALAKLSDEASDPVVIMNRNTYAAFKTMQYAANFPVDPFEGLPVLFNSAVPDIADSGSGAPYMIVGDLYNGYLVNFPEGEEVRTIRDDYSLAEADLIKIVGRLLAGHGVVAPNAFVNVIADDK